MLNLWDVGLASLVNSMGVLCFKDSVNHLSSEPSFIRLFSQLDWKSKRKFWFPVAAVFIQNWYKPEMFWTHYS